MNVPRDPPRLPREREASLWAVVGPPLVLLLGLAIWVLVGIALARALGLA